MERVASLVDKLDTSIRSGKPSEPLQRRESKSSAVPSRRSARRSEATAGRHCTCFLQSSTNHIDDGTLLALKAARGRRTHRTKIAHRQAEILRQSHGDGRGQGAHHNAKDLYRLPRNRVALPAASTDAIGDEAAPSLPDHTRSPFHCCRVLRRHMLSKKAGLRSRPVQCCRHITPSGQSG